MILLAVTSPRRRLPSHLTSAIVFSSALTRSCKLPNCSSNAVAFDTDMPGTTLTISAAHRNPSDSESRFLRFEPTEILERSTEEEDA